MSAATDKTNLAELRRTMTLWHNRVTALGFDGVSDLIALAEAGGEEIKKAWPIDEGPEDPECHWCRGDGMDPYTDSLLPCPHCQGEQRP